MILLNYGAEEDSRVPCTVRTSNQSALKEINQMATRYEKLSKEIQNKIIIRKSFFQLDT